MDHISMRARSHSTSGDTIARPRALPFGRIATVLVVAAAATVIAMGQLVPRPVDDSPFDTAAAVRHLRFLAAEPRPVGSEAHKRAQDYIARELRSAGLSPNIFEQVVIRQRNAGRVRNMTATVPGVDSRNPLLLVAHYDTVPGSPGAADDAFGVAMVLTTVQTLSRGAQPPRDVVALFTDGEEAGLLGAQGFKSSHRELLEQTWGVINFEARGSRGPAVMFETLSPAGASVAWLGRASRPVRASSVYQEVYAWLPYSTDFAVLKEGPARGLSFAIIGSSDTYHSRDDDADRIDGRDMADLGGLIQSLIAQSADTPRSTASVSYIYFDIAGQYLVTYPTTLAAPIAVFSLIVVVGMVWWLRRARALSVVGVIVGYGLHIANAVLTSVCAVILARFSWPATSLGPAAIGWTCIALAIQLAIFGPAMSRLSVRGLVAGAALFLVTVSCAAALLAPGVSYLFQWPALATIAWAAACGSPTPLRWRDAALLCAATTVAAALWLPVLTWIWVGLTVTGTPIAAALTAIALAPLAPLVLTLRSTTERGWLAVAVIGSAGLLLVTDMRMLAAGANLNDSSRRILVTRPDGQPSQWVRFNTVDGSHTASMEFPSYGSSWIASDTTPLHIAGPVTDVLGDVRVGSMRTLRLRLRSMRGAPVMYFALDASEALDSVRLADTPLDVNDLREARQHGFWVRYVNLPPEGIELEIRTMSSEPIAVYLCDQTFDLPPGLVDVVPTGRRAGWLAESTLATGTRSF